MSSGSRHAACKSCRERKVRCDGAQPACDKCTSAGESCVYLPMQKPTKADLTQTVEALQKRLDETEAQLSALSSRSVHDSIPHQSYSLSTDWPPAPLAFPRASGFMDEPANMLGSPFMLPSHFTPSPNISNQSEPPHNGMDWQGGPSSDAIFPRLVELSAFLTSIYQSQSEISGISMVVADYVSWMRKVPSRSLSTPDTTLVNLGMLETVEKRLRELGHIAQTRHHDAFEKMITSLNSLGTPDSGAALSLRELEKRLQKGSEEYSQFFSTRYSACASLSEQLDQPASGLSGVQAGNAQPNT